MLSDIEIAQAAKTEPIAAVADKLGIPERDWIPYGRDKAKVDYSVLKQDPGPQAKLVLVTAINPTPAGEGKTTTTIGLADALRQCGSNAVVALREPSLGPVFGIKGGAAGGGYAQEPGNPYQDGLRRCVAGRYLPCLEHVLYGGDRLGDGEV